MKMFRKSTRRGFSLVELLAVVLVLAVLAGVAVPLYLNSRKTAAARTCKGNIATIAAAQAAYSTRFSTYVGGTAWTANYTAGTSGGAPTGGLVGAPEGLATAPVCPLANKAYTCTLSSGAVAINCADASVHATDTGAAATTWQVTLQPAGADTTNPL